MRSDGDASVFDRRHQRRRIQLIIGLIIIGIIGAATTHLWPASTVSAAIIRNLIVGVLGGIALVYVSILSDRRHDRLGASRQRKAARR